MNFWSYENKFILPGIAWMRPFVWHPQTNPFPKTKVDRFNRKKPFLKMSDTVHEGVAAFANLLTVCLLICQFFGFLDSRFAICRFSIFCLFLSQLCMSLCSSVISFFGLLSLISSFFLAGSWWGESAKRGKNNIPRDAAYATVPTFVEDKKAFLHNGNSLKGGEDGGGRRKSYQCLPGEGGTIRIVSYSGKIEGSNSHGEGLRKILYQAYHMLKEVKSVDKLTCQNFQICRVFLPE
jgi:hypothetical protein